MLQILAAQNITGIYGSGENLIAKVSESAALENMILRDLQKKTRTYIESDKTVPNDFGFIKTKILPAFVKLYKKWPDAYNLLMKSNLEIAIIKYDSALFYEKHRDDKRNKYYFTRVTTCTANFCIDKSIICINAYDYYKKIFPAILFLEDAFHEVMHAVSYLSVKDAGKTENLSAYLDKNSALTAIAKNYIDRQNKTIKDLFAWKESNFKKYKNEIDFYKAYYRQYAAKIKEYGCWAARKFNPKGGESIKSFFRSCFPNLIKESAEELLAEGLSHYYGTIEEHSALKKYEPALYKIIKNNVAPTIKNAPVDTDGKPVEK